MTLAITTISVLTFSIIIKRDTQHDTDHNDTEQVIIMLNVTCAECHIALHVECRYDECRYADGREADYRKLLSYF